MIALIIIVMFLGLLGWGYDWFYIVGLYILFCVIYSVFSLFVVPFFLSLFNSSKKTIGFKELWKNIKNL